MFPKSCVVAVVFTLAAVTGHPPAAVAAVSCDLEVTGSVGVTRSGYRLNRRLDLFVQTLTIRNGTGSTIQGPIVAGLTNLSANATLVNAAGPLPCAGPGGPSIEIGVGPDNFLSPGETASVVLQFENTTMGGIRYDLRLFASMLPVSPIGDVSVMPDVIFVGTPAQVTIRAVSPYQGAPPTLTLQRVDEAGNVLSVEGVLVDNGSLAAGDEIQGDGLFSFRRTYQLPAVQDIRFRIQRNDGTTTASFLLRVVTPLTSNQLTEIVSLQAALEDLYWNDPGGPAAGLAAVLAALGARSDVLDYGVSESGNGVWILHSPGILGGLMLNPPGTRGTPLTASAGRTSTAWPAGTNGWSDLARPATMTAGPPATRGPMALAQGPISSTNDVGSTKVLVASPFLFQFGATDEGSGLRTLYQNSTCPKFDVTFLSNTQFTVDVARSMSGYGVVHVATHGDTYYNGILSLWQDKFGWSVPGSQVIFLTGQTATAANLPSNQVDLAAGRLAIVSGYYGILPSFVSAYGPSYPNSLVFIGACRSTFNSTMANAFLGRGAGTYLGFSEYVASSFAFGRANYFHQNLVQDPNALVTTGQIFIPGQSDSSTPPAFWQMSGSNTLQLPGGNQLQNGGFESGTLGAWSATGDGRVVAQLGAFFYPTEGAFAGLISTGLGFTTSSGAISQNICLPADSKTLTFDWNFTSEEFREWCGSQFQDFFRVQVVTDSSTVTLFNRRVDDLCAGTVKVPFSFDQGDAWSYGWQTTSLDISALATANSGKPVRLVFSAGDVGDSIFDTAVMLDRIEIAK